VLHLVQLDLALGRVVTTSSDLVREVESVGLFLRAENRNEVKSTFAQQKVTGVAQVTSVQFGLFALEKCDHTRATACLMRISGGVDQELLGVGVVVAFSSWAGHICCDQPVDICAQLA